jgi:hypothetical protein
MKQWEFVSENNIARDYHMESDQSESSEDDTMIDIETESNHSQSTEDESGPDRLTLLVGAGPTQSLALPKHVRRNPKLTVALYA